MELVHDTIFIDFFDVQTIQIEPLECARRLTHYFKKMPKMAT